MHHLIFDTCVWVDLAVSEFSLVPKLARLIEDGKVTIIIPQLVRSEWDGCKRKIITQLTNEIVETRRFADKFMSFVKEGESSDFYDLVLSVDPTALGAKISAQRILAIENLLDADTTVCVPVSPRSESLAIAHALQKKAPFRQKNSMADALIFFTAVEWVDTINAERSIFVTHNTKDFSDEKRGDEDASFKERLAPDLLPLVEKNGLKFAVVVGRALNDIEQFTATEEEINQGETIVRYIRTRDDLLQEMMSGGAFAKMLEEQRNMDEIMSGGAVANMLEEQRKMDEMMSGGAFAKMLKEQRNMEEIMSGGAVAKMLEEQRNMDEIMSGGAVAKMLEKERRIEEIMTGGAAAKMLEEQRKLDEIMSGGAVGKMLKEQRKMEEIMSGGAAAKLLEEQRKMDEIMSGGAVGKMLKEQRRMEEIMSGGAAAKMLEELRKWKK